MLIAFALVRRVGCAVLVSALAACAAPGLRVEVNPPVEPIQIVAISPVELAYDDSLYESERRTEDVLAEVWEASTWPILAPTEFLVADLNARDPIAGTDATVRVRELGLSAGRLALLRTQVSLREAQGSATVSGRGALAIGGSYEGSVAVSLELHKAGGGLVASADVVDPLDPFAEHPDWDQRPEVRAAIKKAVRAMIEACQGCVDGGGPIQLSTYPTTSAILRGYRTRFRTTAQALTPKEGAEYEAGIWRVMQYFHSGISAEWAKRLEGLPPGFCINAPAPPPFKNGDCVVAVAGAPATTPHALRRARVLSPNGKKVTVTVIGKNGVARNVEF